MLTTTITALETSDDNGDVVQYCKRRSVERVRLNRFHDIIDEHLRIIKAANSAVVYLILIDLDQ